MRRSSRTFKLRLSPAGMEMLIEAHCHLIRSTRALIAWGTTLQVAVANLETLPAEIVVAKLATLPMLGLSGEEEHHLGAPQGVNERAAHIADRVQATGTPFSVPMLSSIYLVALMQLRATDETALREIFMAIRRGSVSSIV